MCIIACLCVCMYIMYIPDACRGQKSATKKGKRKERKTITKITIYTQNKQSTTKNIIFYLFSLLICVYVYVQHKFEGHRRNFLWKLFCF